MQLAWTSSCTGYTAHGRVTSESSDTCHHRSGRARPEHGFTLSIAQVQPPRDALRPLRPMDRIARDGGFPPPRSFAAALVAEFGHRKSFAG
jgi:hypothetical protein